MNIWHNHRLLNALSNGLLMVLCLSLATGGLLWVARHPAFRLQSIAVQPIPGQAFQYLDPRVLEADAPRRLSGTFFTVDLGAVREAFEAMPWVRRAEVRRVWPDRIQVALEEQRPLARWKAGGMVNAEGEWFDPRITDPARAQEIAPRLFEGPPGTQAMVTRTWHELLAQLAPLRLEPRSVVLSDRQAWSAVMNNGLEVLIGRETGIPVQERVARWVSVHASLQARLAHTAEVIDLRYPNGFAVRAPAALDQARPASSRRGR